MYNLSVNNYLKFINNVNIDDISMSKIDILDVLYNIKNIIVENNNKKTNKNDLYNSLDTFIIVFYSFCISMFIDNPKIFYNILMNINNANNKINLLQKNPGNTNNIINKYILKLFEVILINKIYIYDGNRISSDGEFINKNYIKLVSLKEIIISHAELNNKEKLDSLLNDLTNIKNNLIQLFQTDKYNNVKKYL